MERSQTIGFILIFLVLMAWLWLNTPPPDPMANRPAPTAADSTREAVAQSGRTTTPAEIPTAKDTSVGKYFAGRDLDRDRSIIVETDLFRVVLSTKGASIAQWELKTFNTWDGYPVQLVRPGKGDLSMLFGTADGKTLSSRTLTFDAPPGITHVQLDENNAEYELTFSLPAATGGRIVKSYLFRNDSYGADIRYRFEDLGNVIANFEYEIAWANGVPYAEHNSVDESGFAAAYAYAGGELLEIDAPTVGERTEKTANGQVDWVGTRNKYFAVAMIPVYPTTEGAILEGTARTAADQGQVEDFGVAIRFPFRGSVAESAMIRVYAGPLDRALLTPYEKGLEKMLSLGWAWIIRPIAEYIFLPLFNGLHYFISNWGIVIIIFSIIVKLALHPLTKSSMKSMKKMQALQPMMEELKVKYKDDPQKMNQAVMNLYKEYGVNPAGGCLPLLLQMPILYALFAMFRSTIDLRQASFVGWITDLSVPDVAFSLPFHIPIFAVKDVSGIALLMGVTMFIQQKMSVKDPRQKMMIWIMPIMFTLLFNSFPSGLNLYYAVFNVLSIAQQAFMNKEDDGPPRKVEPKKKRGGIFKNMPDIKQLRKR